MDGCSRCTGGYGEDGGDLRMEPQGWSFKRGDGVRRRRSEESIWQTTDKGRTSESGRDNRRINTPCGEIHHTEVQMWRNTLHLYATKAVILQRKTKL